MVGIRRIKARVRFGDDDGVLEKGRCVADCERLSCDFSCLLVTCRFGVVVTLGG